MEAEDETRGRMPPIKVKFEIPYFTVSGIQVHTLWLDGVIMLAATEWNSRHWFMLLAIQTAAVCFGSCRCGI